jgi:ribonuclease BN (tRNA processing enzyme)
MATQLILLGTGTPRPDPDRIGACVAIIADGQPYLVDFGPGVMLRVAQARHKGISALDPQRLTRAFLTHLHADHCAGYADLLFTAWLHGRAEPLDVYGPRGLAEMTDHIHAAYRLSTEEHLRAHPTDPRGHQALAHEVSPGRIYEDERVRVVAFPVEHGDLTAYGYQFTTADTVIVISGDTRPCPALAQAAHACDVLVHVHSAAADVGALAAQAGVKTLILYHQLLWGATEADLLAEARRHYHGELFSARDLDSWAW